jgi:peptidoglycan-associated lipoprotein
MMRIFLGLLALGTAASASAQLRAPAIVQRVIPGTRQQPIAAAPVDVLRADFLARTGGDTIFFGNNVSGLALPARTTLAAQAAWLRLHPEVLVRIEGHGDTGDTRDHALAMGARRAEEVRSYLVLLGVPAGQVTTTSMGKERPGSPRAVTVLVQ